VLYRAGQPVGWIRGYKRGVVLRLAGHDLGQSKQRPDLAYFPHFDDAWAEAVRRAG